MSLSRLPNANDTGGNRIVGNPSTGTYLPAPTPVGPNNYVNDFPIPSSPVINNPTPVNQKINYLNKNNLNPDGTPNTTGIPIPFVSTTSTNYLPWLIGGGILLVLMVL